MCLGVPGKVLEIDGLMATVDFWGIRKQVRLDVVDAPVTPGDYILNHVGFAIRRIPPEEGQATLRLYQDLLRQQEAEDREDLMAADIRAEISGAGLGRWGDDKTRF
jgi:hydrogenase expression/formation protein HypC